MSACAGNRETVSSGSGQRFSFPRQTRLLRHADFERVYQQGKRHFSAHMTVFFRAREPGTGLRIGFTVGRALGAAVDRNFMKRRLREAVRLRRPAAALPADVVINPKKSLLRADFADVLSEISRAFEVIAAKTSNPVDGTQGKLQAGQEKNRQLK